MIFLPLREVAVTNARTLRLRTEVLGELTAEELTHVAAGAAPTVPLNTCVFCVTQASDCVCISQRVTQCC